jgi:hypothetical protein
MCRTSLDPGVRKKSMNHKNTGNLLRSDQLKVSVEFWTLHKADGLREMSKDPRSSMFQALFDSNVGLRLRTAISEFLFGRQSGNASWYLNE